MKVVHLFESYAHTEWVWRDRLEPVLKVELGVSLGQRFHDKELKAGDPWDASIQTALGRMDIFLPLVSYDFLASDYIRTVEIPKAEALHREGKLEVVPILLAELDLERLCPFLNQFNPLPAWGRCWMGFNPRKGANHLIGNGLKQAIEKARARRRV